MFLKLFIHSWLHNAIIAMHMFCKVAAIWNWFTCNWFRYCCMFTPYIQNGCIACITITTHTLGKHMEGRANNFKKPINISRFPCISQQYILTNRWAAWILCVTCYRNISHMIRLLEMGTLRSGLLLYALHSLVTSPFGLLCISNMLSYNFFYFKVFEWWYLLKYLYTSQVFL